MVGILFDWRSLIQLLDHGLAPDINVSSLDIYSISLNKKADGSAASCCVAWSLDDKPLAIDIAVPSLSILRSLNTLIAV